MPQILLLGREELTLTETGLLKINNGYFIAIIFDIRKYMLILELNIL